MALEFLEDSFFHEINGAVHGGGGLPARVELLEANFEVKSAYVDDLNETAAGVGISVLALGLFGTAEQLASTNASVNKIKDCLVSHNLMEAA